MRIKFLYLDSFLMICTLLLISLYLQFYQGIIPCPLCTLQRLTFALLGILFLVGVLLNRVRVGRILIDFLVAASSILGLSLASRQIWLQHFPSSSSTECGVNLHYMMQVLPMNELMRKIFEGSAECSKRGWEFLNLNMAEWAIIWFALFFALSIYLLTREFHRR